MKKKSGQKSQRAIKLAESVNKNEDRRAEE